MHIDLATVLLPISLVLLGLVVFLFWDRRRLQKGYEQIEEGSSNDKIGDNEKQGDTAANTEKVVRQLREQLSSFDQAMAQCPSSIIITDLDGNIEFVNARFTGLSGYKMEEVIGRNPRFLKSGNMEPEIYKDLWDTITKGEVWRGDLENRSKDGRIFWEHTSISPIKDSEGRILRYFAVKEDISEVRHQQDETRRAHLEADAAKAADHAKAVFLKLIGQEMKNPINRLLGFTNLVSQTALDKDQLSQVNQIGGAGLELLTLINRILDFTSAEAGTMDLEFTPFKPRETVDRLLTAYERKASEKNITILRDIQENLPQTVVGDEKRFRDVIDALLDNAVHSTFVGSVKFRLSARFNQKNRIWEFSGEVSDTGKGIPQEKLDSLFKPFAQAESGFGEGVGLGLALCQRLCILQGGSLDATSELGKGSAFAFSLRFQPTDQEDPVLQSPPMPEGRDFAQEYPLDILIAEDNRINRRLLETLMNRMGYQATFALDGTSVMAEVRKRAYELIFMDLEMPFMSGIEAARRIRAGEAGDQMKDVRIVAITAFSTDENIQESKEASMDSFLVKPFDISKIKMEIIHAYKAKMARKAG